MGKIHAQEAINAAARVLSAGGTTSEASAASGIPVKTLHSMKRQGVVPRPQWTEQRAKRTAEVRRLLRDGWKEDAIAHQLGITHARVNQIKNGVGVKAAPTDTEQQED